MPICPDCKESFKIDLEEFDEGDLINCPSCNLELTVIKKGKKYSVQTVKEKFLEDEDFFEEDDENYGAEEDDSEEF